MKKTTDHPELAQAPHNTSDWLALTSANTTGGERVRSAHRASATPLAWRPDDSTVSQIGWGDVVVLVAPGADPVALSAELAALSAVLLEQGSALLEQCGFDEGPTTVNDSERATRHMREATHAARSGARWLNEGVEPPPGHTDEVARAECASE